VIYLVGFFRDYRKRSRVLQYASVFETKAEADAAVAEHSQPADFVTKTVSVGELPLPKTDAEFASTLRDVFFNLSIL